MIAFFVDYELDTVECAQVEEAVGEPVELVRLPFLFPLREAGDTARALPQRVRPHLVRAGIDRLRGRQVLLVAPRALFWYASLAEAIRRETGRYPLLVQPSRRRAEAGCPGPLRILDMEAYLMGEDAAGPPPWQEEDPDR